MKKKNIILLKRVRPLLQELINLYIKVGQRSKDIKQCFYYHRLQIIIYFKKP